MNPHASSIHPVIQTSTIILWTELFPKKRREKIQGEILQSIFEYSGVSTFYKELHEIHPFYKNYSVSTCNPASFQSSRAKKTILHTELILLQEFFKKYYNYKALPMQTNTRHLPATVPRVSKHSTWQNPATRAIQHKQASSNSTQQKQYSKWQSASMQPLQ